MATKQYLDKAGLKKVLEKLKEKFADIGALAFQDVVQDVASLPSLSDTEMRAGLLYTIQDEDVTTPDFVEGAGKTIDPWSEVVTINVGTIDAPSYKWYVLGNVFTVKDRIPFGTTFPAAPFDGQAFLYLGADQYSYTYVRSPATADDPAVFGWYVSDGSGGYTPATDHTPIAGTSYYTREDAAIKGGIYEWDDTNSEWVNVNDVGHIDYITETEVNDLFNELWP